MDTLVGLKDKCKVLENECQEWKDNQEDLEKFALSDNEEIAHLNTRVIELEDLYKDMEKNCQDWKDNVKNLALLLEIREDELRILKMKAAKATKGN